MRGPLDKNLILPTALALLLAAVSLAGERGVLWLRYDRFLIADGEWWRIITSHLVHTGTGHLLLNLAGLFVIFLALGQLYPPQTWLLSLIICMAGISSGQLLFCPELQWYVGFSGVLHGLAVMGFAGGIRNGDRLCLIGLTALLAKLLIEQLYGPSAQTVHLIHAPVIVNAHLYGAVSGGAAACLSFLCRARPAIHHSFNRRAVI